MKPYLLVAAMLALCGTAHAAVSLRGNAPPADQISNAGRQLHSGAPSWLQDFVAKTKLALFKEVMKNSIHSRVCESYSHYSVTPMKEPVTCPTEDSEFNDIPEKDICKNIKNPNPEVYVYHENYHLAQAATGAWFNDDMPGYYPKKDPLRQQVCGTPGQGGATCHQPCCLAQRAYCQRNCGLYVISPDSGVAGVPCLKSCMRTRGCWALRPENDQACFTGLIQGYKPVDESTCHW